MSVSAIFGTRIATTLPPAHVRTAPPARDSGMAMVIECSSRPNKKGTAHHMKTRPKKTSPWEIRRRPAVYPPLPQLPPEWTLVSSGDNDVAAVAAPPSSTQSTPQTD